MSEYEIIIRRNQFKLKFKFKLDLTLALTFQPVQDDRSHEY